MLLQLCGQRWWLQDTPGPPQSGSSPPSFYDLCVPQSFLYSRVSASQSLFQSLHLSVVPPYPTTHWVSHPPPLPKVHFRTTMFGLYSEKEPWSRNPLKAQATIILFSSLLLFFEFCSRIHKVLLQTFFSLTHTHT